MVPSKTCMRRAGMMTSIQNEILGLNRTVHPEGTKTLSIFLDRSSGTVYRRTLLSICSCEKCFGLSAAALSQAVAPGHRQQPLPSLGQKWRTRPSTSSRHRGFVHCVSLLYSRAVVETPHMSQEGKKSPIPTGSSIYCVITT